MSEVIVIGCTSDHGGKVISGDSGIMYQGKQVALVGDRHQCPKKDCDDCSPHGVTTIVSTPQSRLSIGGRLVAVDGAKAACGATIRACSDGSLKVS